MEELDANGKEVVRILRLLQGKLAPLPIGPRAELEPLLDQISAPVEVVPVDFANVARHPDPDNAPHFLLGGLTTLPGSPLEILATAMQRYATEAQAAGEVDYARYVETLGEAWLAGQVPANQVARMAEMVVHDIQQYRG